MYLVNRRIEKNLANIDQVSNRLPIGMVPLNDETTLWNIRAYNRESFCGGTVLGLTHPSCSKQHVFLVGESEMVLNLLGEFLVCTWWMILATAYASACLRTGTILQTYIQTWRNIDSHGCQNRERRCTYEHEIIPLTVNHFFIAHR